MLFGRYSNMSIATDPTADDLRALLARLKVPAYRVAARIRLHPVHLSRLLHGHVPFRPDMARRIAVGIEEEAQAR